MIAAVLFALKSWGPVKWLLEHVGWPILRVLLILGAAWLAWVVASSWYDSQISAAEKRGRDARIAEEELQISIDKAALQASYDRLAGEKSQIERRLDAADSLLENLRQRAADDAKRNAARPSCFDDRSLQLIDRFKFQGKHPAP